MKTKLFTFILAFLFLGIAKINAQQKTIQIKIVDGEHIIDTIISKDIEIIIDELDLDSMMTNIKINLENLDLDSIKNSLDSIQIIMRDCFGVDGEMQNFFKEINFDTLGIREKIESLDIDINIEDIMQNFPEEINVFLDSFDIDSHKNCNNISVIILNNQDTTEHTFESSLGKRQIQIRIINLSDKEKKSIDFEENQEELNIEQFNFYPNPNNGRFILNFKLEEKGKTDIEIFNIKGEKVYYESLDNLENEYKKEIDLTSKGKGIYFIKIIQDKKLMCKKLIIE